MNVYFLSGATQCTASQTTIADVLTTAHCNRWVMGCLHNPANVQQTSSKCIQNTRANAGRLLEVCWIV